MRHSFQPCTGTLTAHPKSGLQFQYNTFFPFCLNQSHSTACHKPLISLRKLVSAAALPLKYWRAVNRPIIKKEVSTRSAPLSFEANGTTAPVPPFIHCG